MFSHIVTAAKGLFTRQDTDKAQSKKFTTTSSDNTIASKSKMVTTRRRKISDVVLEEEAEINRQQEVNGKRKSGPAGSGKTETQRNKRRKRASLEAAESESGTPEEPSDDAQETDSKPEEGKAAPAPKKHFRFDSEEPEVPLDMQIEETAETQQAKEDSGDDSSDDEAPEAVDNSAQLSKVRAQAKKMEKAKQLEEELKREKRRQLDELRKSQAKVSKKKDKPVDDLLSESTETLQGSNTQDARRSALPALLPDDILNAAPVTRPPTPPAEEINIAHKKPTKLKFLEKSERRPKDVKMGDVTIRVLGDIPQKRAKSALPPKASKSGRNSKQTWLDRSRSTGHVNGLRRTAGGSSGFVRK
ncbi:putative immediate-early protein [Aspergillus bombycis]|uniref:Putative immediate-early protein n=1 Tax=Aspergillus bombycis TaxID=109264 RepID=A0A1F8A1Z9_9EURO|nr:putative immediate-early protein [Aspergillus bombycis]OGM45449.1 putative immediate-early protein [Aspergillus bombycis]